MCLTFNVAAQCNQLPSWPSLVAVSNGFPSMLSTLLQKQTITFLGFLDLQSLT